MDAIRLNSDNLAALGNDLDGDIPAPQAVKSLIAAAARVRVPWAINGAEFTDSHNAFVLSPVDGHIVKLAVGITTGLSNHPATVTVARDGASPVSGLSVSLAGNTSAGWVVVARAEIDALNGAVGKDQMIKIALSSDPSGNGALAGYVEIDPA